MDTCIGCKISSACYCVGCSLERSTASTNIGYKDPITNSRYTSVFKCQDCNLMVVIPDCKRCYNDALDTMKSFECPLCNETDDEQDLK